MKPQFLSRRNFISQSSVAALSGLALAEQLSAPLKNHSSTKSLIADLEKLVPEIRQQLKVAGLSIALIRDANLVWSRSYGDRNAETKLPVTTETIFEAASLSKPIFAYAVLKLYEKGLLELDAPLTKYLPEPYLPEEPELQLITARHVLTHSPGFPNWRPFGKPLKINFTPGEKFSYSGEGFVYLQKVVETLTHQPLATYLHDQVIKPLGLKNSSFVWLDRYEANFAQGHNKAEKPVNKMKPGNANAAASLHTTAEDYARFVIEILKPAKKDQFHLTDKTIVEMLKPQIKVRDNISWGLGWGLQQTQPGDSFWHWGNNNGVFMNFVVAYKKEKIGLVILTNGSNGMKLCQEVVPQAMGGSHPAFLWSMVL